MIEIIKNKEEVKSVMNIIQAFADGKTIQAIDPYDDEWCNQTKLNFEALFEGQYRIKPEQKYRSFKNAEERWNEMQKHQPFGWVIKKGEKKILITEVLTFGVNLHRQETCYGFYESSKILTFVDGTPFGVKVEK